MSSADSALVSLEPEETRGETSRCKEHQSPDTLSSPRFVTEGGEAAVSAVTMVTRGRLNDAAQSQALTNEHRLKEGDFRMRRHATMGLAFLLSALVSFSAVAAGGKKKAAAVASDAGASGTAPGAAPILGTSPIPATDGGAVAVPGPSMAASSDRPEKPAMDGPTYAVRLRDLEARVDELKDQIRRSHTRLALLSDTIMSGGASGSRAEVAFDNEMSNAFRLVRALFVIDGTVQYNRQDETGALADQKNIPIFSGSVPPGDHTVQVLLSFQGNGYGVFTYLKGYHFEVKSSHSFTAVEGRTLALTATALEKGGVTTPLEQRPSVEWHEKVGPIGAPGTPATTPAPAGAAKAAPASASVSGSVSIGGGKP
jgi:hypothetical protein